MGKVQPRDVSPLLQALRNILLGRTHTPALRFEHLVASRSPPPPILPDGPTHKLSANYYCDRDARREVQPPTVIAAAASKIPIGTSAELSSKFDKLPTPGCVYRWD